ncbi:MAG: hypothetical protein ACR2H1_00330 [Limisphaerales bacterium]
MGQVLAGADQARAAMKLDCEKDQGVLLICGVRRFAPAALRAELNFGYCLVRFYYSNRLLKTEGLLA